MNKKTTTRSTNPGRAVAQLREELHNYHIEVVQTLATVQANCKHCHSQIESLDLQVNGEKPARDDAPSLIHDIASLKQSRNSLRHGIQVAWAVLIGLGGLVVGMFTFRIPK